MSKATKEYPIVPAPFVDYATMFKLMDRDEPLVTCVNCTVSFPLSDLMDYELEEHHCPACGMTASRYYRNRPHRKVPKDPDPET